MYNNSVARASSPTPSPDCHPLTSLLAPRSHRSEGPPSPKSAGSPRVRAGGDTLPIRARPLLILVLDGERSSIPFAIVAPTTATITTTTLLSLRSSRPVSVFSRSHTEIRAAMKATVRAGGSLAGNTHESLPLKYRSGFLRARQRIAIPAYTQACLIDLLGLCFCGIPRKARYATGGNRMRINPSVTRV